MKQQQDLAEQQHRERGYKTVNDFDEESLYGDKVEGGGGFAGADPKKRRGVRSFVEPCGAATDEPSREPLLRVAAIVAIEPKRQNGDEAPTVPGRFATLVGFVRLPSRGSHFGLADIVTDYAKLTRKMGSSKASIGSNLRPKESSPTLPQ